MKWYSVASQMMWVGCKCILKTQRKPIKKLFLKKNVTAFLKEEKKQLAKSSIKAKEGIKNKIKPKMAEND